MDRGPPGPLKPTPRAADDGTMRTPDTPLGRGVGALALLVVLSSGSCTRTVEDAATGNGAVVPEPTPDFSPLPRFHIGGSVEALARDIPVSPVRRSESAPGDGVIEWRLANGIDVTAWYHSSRVVQVTSSRLRNVPMPAIEARRLLVLKDGVTRHEWEAAVGGPGVVVAQNATALTFDGSGEIETQTQCYAIHDRTLDTGRQLLVIFRDDRVVRFDHPWRES